MLVTWLNKKGTILRERIVQIMPDVIISAAEPILPVLGSGITTFKTEHLGIGICIDSEITSTHSSIPLLNAGGLSVIT